MPQPGSILFVSHKANRSGAPLLLLDIIREFKQRTGMHIQILVIEDGELVKDFKILGETFIWRKRKNIATVSLAAMLSVIFDRVIILLRGLYILFRIRNTAVVFFNTITNGHLHKKLLFLKCKYVCYVHELEAAIHMLTEPDTLGVVFSNTDMFLSVSNAVKLNLVNHHRVADRLVKVIASPIANPVRDEKQYQPFTDSLKKLHHIPGDAVIIGVLASNEWRKGFDMFPTLVTLYLNLYPESNVRFIWKGFKEQHYASFLDRYDYQKSGNHRHMILLPHDQYGIDTLAGFDIHLLLSREDPYPLVMLEAASFAIPTVCFSDSGGSPEFVEQDAGYCIPYGDLLNMAKCLHTLVIDENLRNTMGQRARQKLQERHNEKTTMNEIMGILSDIVARAK